MSSDAGRDSAAVQGVLLAAGGAPLRGSVTALVRGRQVGRSTTGPAGHFRCSTGDGASCVLVLAAPGHRPRARQVSTSPGETLALEPIVLEPLGTAAPSTSVPREESPRRRRAPQQLLVGLGALVVCSAAVGTAVHGLRDSDRQSGRPQVLPAHPAASPAVSPAAPPSAAPPSAGPPLAAPRTAPAPTAAGRVGAAQDLLLSPSGWSGLRGKVGFADGRVALLRGGDTSLTWTASVRQHWQDYVAQVYVSALTPGATGALVLAPGTGAEIDVALSRGALVVRRGGAVGPTTLGQAPLPTTSGHALALTVRPGSLTVFVDGQVRLALHTPAEPRPGLGVQLHRGTPGGPVLDQLLVQRRAAPSRS